MSDSLFMATLFPLTVATGATVSRSLDMRAEAYDAEAITVQAPASIDGKSYTWEVSLDGTNFATLEDTTETAIPVPAASKAIIYNGVFTGIRLLRLKASGAVSADVVFQLTKSCRA